MATGNLPVSRRPMQSNFIELIWQNVVPYQGCMVSGFRHPQSHSWKLFDVYKYYRRFFFLELLIEIRFVMLRGQNRDLIFELCFVIYKRAPTRKCHNDICEKRNSFMNLWYWTDTTHNHGQSISHGWPVMWRARAWAAWSLVNIRTSVNHLAKLREQSIP